MTGMHPLDALGRDTATRLVGVVFDIDDTLTREGVLESEAYGALFALRDAGLARVAVTGRPLGFAEVFAQSWPVDLALGENGAGWFRRRPGGRLESGYFDDAATREAQRARLDALRATLAAAFPRVCEVDDRTLRRTDIAFDIGEHDRVDEAVIVAMSHAIEREGFRAVRSSIHLHAVASRADKATGTERAFREALGIDLASDRAKWLFVGDSANDAPAFAYFPVSAGPSNVLAAASRLPTPPAFVASRDRGLGFADIVAHVLECRR